MNKATFSLDCNLEPGIQLKYLLHAFHKMVPEYLQL